METQVRTPQAVFMLPQRLIVPLFQRPYVWNEENQWEPLWNDVVRVAERLLTSPYEKPSPHFLGAVVLQQVQNPVGTLQERTIIDGQQRLTTLQLLFDGLHAALKGIDAEGPAKRLEPLVKNNDAFCRSGHPEDLFKVWPTNRDRPAFHAVMGASLPLDYKQVGHAGEKMVEAHRYFHERAREWLLAEGTDAAAKRAPAVDTVVRELFQMVVIDLGADENAQEIFETLNARGAQLTAADLIKNFIFQRLLESDVNADVEHAYQQHWREFETAFWETEVSFGRVRYPRSAVFLNHWLIARTGEEIVAREVFTRFKRYALDFNHPMSEVLEGIHRAAAIYREFVAASDRHHGPVDRFELFSYRTSMLESEVIKPLVLYLLDPDCAAIPPEQLNKCWRTLESWMVRRMLIRATTKSYNQIVAELITHLNKVDRDRAGNAIESYLKEQTSDSRFWPDDDQVREELRSLMVYRKLRRGRLRMVLEAIEDSRRGWRDEEPGLSGDRVTRGKLHIEHIMPQAWHTHWPHPPTAEEELQRGMLVHTIGNLTLLNGKLNAKVANGPWMGDQGKRQALKGHDVLLLNRELWEDHADQWNEELIRERTESLIDAILRIWPVPIGHRGPAVGSKLKLVLRIGIADLLSAGYLQPGHTLYPRTKKFAGRTATILSDGRIDVDGQVYSSPSDAAKAIKGYNVNGWWFFVTDPKSRKSLKKVRFDYLASINGDLDDEEEIEDDDE